MCGIAGILDSRPSASAESLGKPLRQMLDALRHRGPDDRGEEKFPTENGPTLYLGHQRLSVIDLSPGGHQPMPNADRSLWISSNSEIYNYRELRSELANRYQFRTQSDTEVLLRACEVWGTDCLSRLRGMFAFALWDAPRRRLILARDRLGVKPLYYCSSNGYFIFASELRAIQAAGLTETTLNPTALFQYLSFGRVGSPETLLDPIRELPPGHFMVVDENGIDIQEYWNPLSNTDALDSRIDIIEQIEYALEEAVQLRMVSDVPLGAFLSGGIDSSAVVGMMAGNTPQLVKTLAVTFREKQYDESEFSNLVAREFGTDHRELPLTETELLDRLPLALAAMDQPTVDGINMYLIAQSARERGLTVALSGLGGDELFAGYDSFRKVPALAKGENLLSALPGFLRNAAGKILSGFLPDSDKNTKLAHLVQGKYSGAHVYFLFRALFCEEAAVSLFADRDLAVKESVNNLERTRDLIGSKAHLDPVDLISYLELTQYMVPTLLRDTDMMSMAHALEVRVPLIDHKLVELMFSVPSRMKVESGQPKSLLVRALKRKLPDAVVHRKKMGFTLPFENWMRGQMKAEIEEVLLTPSPGLAGILSEEGVRNVWTDFLGKRISWSRPWSLYVLKKWVEKNL